jgi:hypothetical protein
MDGHRLNPGLPDDSQRGTLYVICDSYVVPCSRQRNPLHSLSVYYMAFLQRGNAATMADSHSGTSAGGWHTHSQYFSLQAYKPRRLGRSVNTMTRLWLGRKRNRRSILRRDERCTSETSYGTPQYPTKWIPGSIFAGVKAAETWSIPLAYTHCRGKRIRGGIASLRHARTRHARYQLYLHEYALFFCHFYIILKCIFF